jgi:hypothetical protein
MKIDLALLWDELEQKGITSVHSWRDASTELSWYVQLVHPEKGRVTGNGVTYIYALINALDKY